ASAEEAVAEEVAKQPEKQAEETEREMQPAVASGGGRGPAPGPSGDGGPRSQILSPLVRRLAEEHQVDLAKVQGTGTGGRITKRDVLAFVESGGTATEAPAPSGFPTAAEAARQQLAAVPERTIGGAREEVVPMSHIRKAIAKHMHASVQASARAWNLVEVNMENVARLRERAKGPFRAREGFSLTYMPF